MASRMFRAAALVALPSILLAARMPAQEETGEEVSYSHHIGPIVANYCATCHHGADPDGGFVLDSYSDVREEVELGALLERINDASDPMPPAGLMSERQRALFQAWADRGFVEKGEGPMPTLYEPFDPPEITPIKAEEGGFDLLKRIPGHWVGSMNLMGQEFEWFSWDFRAIAPSHVHGIFEGGTLGNLFTSFFVADFKGTQTVMARNGGLLNGIYRTSYFVLDEVTKKGGATTYRLVDAYGGAGIMWMSLTFDGDSIEFIAHTSRMGLLERPTRHVRFVGEHRHPELAEAAGKAVGFPKLQTEREFPNGLPLPDWGPGVPVTSYSYIWEDERLTLEQLAKVSGDPYRIDEIPHIAKLHVTLERTAATKESALMVYLSREALTDRAGKLRMQWGYIDEEVFDGLLMFPELGAGENEFTFTYLHPGTYYLTVVADQNGDQFPSAGDLSSASQKIEVAPGETVRAKAAGITVKN